MENTDGIDLSVKRSPTRKGIDGRRVHADPRPIAKKPEWEAIKSKHLDEGWSAKRIAALYGYTERGLREALRRAGCYRPRAAALEPSELTSPAAPEPMPRLVLASGQPMRRYQLVLEAPALDVVALGAQLHQHLPPGVIVVELRQQPIPAAPPQDPEKK